MARENKLPTLEYTSTGYHSKILSETTNSYKCYNHSTNEDVTVDKELLRLVKPEMIKEYEQRNK